MKSFKIIGLASVFLMEGNTFSMEINYIDLIENLRRHEQSIRAETWNVKEDLQISATISLIEEYRHIVINDMCKKNFPYIKQILPPEVEIEHLSPTQKEAVVIFESQLDRKGELKKISRPYLLSCAISILTEEQKDKVSFFILQKILNGMPKEFLEDYDG